MSLSSNGSGGGPWKVLVTIHSIFNVPKTVMPLKGKVSFRVSCSCTGPEAKAQGSSCPEVNTSFDPGDIVVATDITEVKLDGTSGSGRGSLEWIVAGANLAEVVISIKEESAAGSKTISTSQPLTIDLKHLVEFRKLTTRVVGTTFGHVGVSFAVAPSDSAGYRRRLEAFLTQYNPAGLEHVARVVSTMSEIDTFTKTYRKYSVIDYEQRIREFFEVYGPDHIAEIPSIMKQWENREEELIRNLVIDNGPELDDVDPKLRLTAFVKQYSIPMSDVDAVLRANPPGDAWRRYMRDLVARYGPDPDPRKYLFPATYYGDPPLRSAQSARQLPTGGAASTSSQQSSPPPPPQRAASNVTAASSAAPLTPQQVVHQTSSAASTSSAALAQFQPQAPASPQRPQPAPSSIPSSAAGTSNVVELWSQLCEQLRLNSVPNSELFYLNEQAFSSVLSELRFDAAAKNILIGEWQRRVSASARQEQLHSGDAMFDSAKRDAFAVTGMHPLNVSVVSVVAIKNPEHEASYSLRLSEAKMRATERLALVGDYAKLMSIVTNGVSPMPQLHHNAPACIFYRRPLHSISRASSVSILICDVAVGKPFVQPATMPQLTTPKAPTPQFVAEYDSCVFVDSTAGQAIAVYQPQQVLPRFIVHCNVDPSVSPCPAHPSRPVEYFVVDANSFACSQCVVLGQHRGKDVLTLEDASMQARNALMDLQRDTQSVATEMSAAEAELDQRMDGMANSELRLAALRAIDQVKREAEQKVQSIQTELEQAERQQRDTISESRQTARRVYEDAQQLIHVLEDGARSKGPVETIGLAVKLKGSGQVLALRERALQVRGAAGQVDLIGNRSISTSHHLPAVAAGSGVFSSLHRLNGGGTPYDATPFNSTSGNLFGASSSSFLQGPQQLGGPTAPQNDTTAHSNSNDLFAKFVSIKQQQQQPIIGTPRATGAASFSNRATTPSRAVPHLAIEGEAKLSKEQMTRGWAEFRRGDRQAAAKTWADVYERNAQNAIGARARAYIAEAIERDYDEAATWYERALSYDNKDTMTLYNYGVLLESVMGKKREALQLFDSAHQLGDHTAGRRAQQLRQQLGGA